VNPDGSYSVVDAPTFTGTATSYSMVAVLEDNVIIGVVVAAGNGVWSFSTADLTDGTHQMTFEAYNQSGNYSTYSSVIVIQVA
jgi:hypothetical protein